MQFGIVTAIYSITWFPGLLCIIGEVICSIAGVGAVARRTSALVQDDILPVIHALVSSIAGADLAADMSLSQAGLDSLASVELRNDLSRYHDYADA